MAAGFEIVRRGSFGISGISNRRRSLLGGFDKLRKQTVAASRGF
jgi:hypothetical protein